MLIELSNEYIELVYVCCRSLVYFWVNWQSGIRAG